MPLGGATEADSFSRTTLVTLAVSCTTHPVCGTVVVHLHRELASGFDVQQLHLKAWVEAEGFKEPPRP